MSQIYVVVAEHPDVNGTDVEPFISQKNAEARAQALFTEIASDLRLKPHERFQGEQQLKTTYYWGWTDPLDPIASGYIKIKQVELKP
ncbi:MAG: hypothetical protein ACTHJR_06435 [Sphingomonas sp.]|uniref:hypothetical protein n=1 Tax=Sphingomonas sp. TaxID=28214 RepID=UPI003F7D4C06